MGALFGGSKQKSTSSNRAFDSLNASMSPIISQTGQSINAVNALLGGDASGFNKFKQATGYDWQAEQGSRGITGNAAARGLLRSGSTGKALTDYGVNLQNKFSNDYLEKLLGIGGMGLNAAGILANAGQTSSSTSKSKPGLGGFLGQIGSGIAASDPRLKEDVEYLGTLPNGLNVYEYTYKHTGERSVGVMADEVEALLPDALGPEVFGFKTVNYDKIKEAIDGRTG